MRTEKAVVIIRWLDEIKNTNKAGKIELLEKRLKDPDFRKVINYALDSSLSFNVSRIAERKPEKGDIFDVLDKLKAKSGATKADKNELAAVASQSDHLLDLTNRILRGRMDAGFDIKTVRLVDPTVVPYNPYCRCSGYDKLSNIDFSKGAVSQIKADGMFMNIRIKRDGITYTTRNGNKLNFLGIPDGYFTGFPDNFVVMGEALLLDERLKKVMPRADGNAIINKAIDGHISEDECRRIRFELWDIIPEDEFDDGTALAPYNKRLDALSQYTHKVFGVRTIETKIVHSIEEAWEHYASVRARGFEGTIVKDLGATWADGTSKYQIKLKAEKECEVEVIGWNPGKAGGKYENAIGSLIVQSSCGKLEGSVSGLTDDQRFQDPEYFIGKIVTVRFNAISKLNSFDHARLIEVRLDKNTADSLEYILNVKEAKR